MIAKLLNRRSAPPPPAPAYGRPAGAPPGDPFYVDTRRPEPDGDRWIPRRPWFSRRPPDDADRR